MPALASWSLSPGLLPGGEEEEGGKGGKRGRRGEEEGGEKWERRREEGKKERGGERGGKKWNGRGGWVTGIRGSFQSNCQDKEEPTLTHPGLPQ